ncbi:hypothetical protein Taro_015801 [Colocasia esculenta]|uniref:Uncharacterized protein n=1 Tax=Colocasia esculenta TaxID=4460 RepID=A0A843UUB8_COLES|nr:hypothetical protein [Colocasia esculenta]
MAQLCRSNTRPGLVPRAAAASSPSSCSSSSPSFSSGEVVMAEEPKRGPLEGLVDATLRELKALRKPAAAVLLLGLLLAAPYAALAASGGRMGGSSFSSSSRYSVPYGSSFSFSTPYSYAPSPFVGGGGGLYRGFVFGFSFFLLMAGVAAVVLLCGYPSDRSDDGSVLTATQKTSVLKLQRRCSHYFVTQTVASPVDVKRSVEDGEKSFNQLSIEERGKFDEETLVNVNSIKRRSSSSSRSNAFSNEYIVVTILVAADGVHKLPVIDGSANLKETLQKLGSIPSRQIMLDRSDGILKQQRPV